MKREYIAVIQAGGKGTRMRELTRDEIPKPLLRLNNKPMIEWQIISLARYGVTKFIFIVGYLGKCIEEYFGDGSKWNIKIKYIYESKPLGSAGALYYAKNYVADQDVILVFGDIMFDIDWKRYLSFHEEQDGIITLLAHPNSHPYDSDLLIADNNDQVLDIDSKSNIRNYYYKNLVNAGLSVFKNGLLSRFCEEKVLDYEADVVHPLMGQGLVYAYRTPEYVKDVGTPERFFSACQEQKKGIWSKKNLSHKQKAIFLDRDGTLNVLIGFLKRAEDFKLLPGVADAIKCINESEYLAIIATNQSVVARGEGSLEELENIHKKLQTDLGQAGAFVNDIFFCPHHPHKGYKGEIPELKIDCDCRKPKIGMLLKAANKYNIDLSNSWYIGDSTIDIQTGINANMKTVLLRTGEGGKDGKYNVVPDYEVNNLKEAIDRIFQERDRKV